MAGGDELADAQVVAEGGEWHAAQEVKLLGPGYRGIVATAPIDEGETLASIPWKLVVADEDTRGARAERARWSCCVLTSMETLAKTIENGLCLSPAGAAARFSPPNGWWTGQ